MTESRTRDTHLSDMNGDRCCTSFGARCCVDEAPNHVEVDVDAVLLQSLGCLEAGFRSWYLCMCSRVSHFVFKVRSLGNVAYADQYVVRLKPPPPEEKAASSGLIYHERSIGMVPRIYIGYVWAVYRDGRSLRSDFEQLKFRS